MLCQVELKMVMSHGRTYYNSVTVDVPYCVVLYIAEIQYDDGRLLSCGCAEWHDNSQ